MRIPNAALAACLVLTAPLAAAGCGGAGGRPRVIVLGFDGLDPAAADLLMSEGKLPNLARLRRQGAYAPLRSARPLLSPVVWTTIATGRTPDEHRIGHFVAVRQATGAQEPVTSNMRKVRALWTIASEAGRSVGVVGWWATWPAERVNGAIVSDRLCYHFLFPDARSGGPRQEGLTWPPDLAAEIAPLVRRPADITAREAEAYISVEEEEFGRPFDFDDDLSHFRWALATTDTYRRVGLSLWRGRSPDLLMVYFEATDSVAHLFGHLFRAQGLSGELARQQARFGSAVEQLYIAADGIVGEYMAAMDRRTALAVLSDHGFRLGAAQEDPSKTRDLRRVSERFHTLDGVLYLYGRGVAQGARLTAPTILDVAPTVLALGGLAPARDMPGRVLTEGLTFEPPAAVETYETGARGLGQEAPRDAAVDAEILERLRSLGYLDTSSPKGESNLAGVLYEEGRFEEAEKAYRAIVKADPADSAARASLAGVLGALGRYEEALLEIDESLALDPLNPEAHHNRAVIHERRGRTEEAIRDYRTALRYAPGYGPSRQALERLGASPVSIIPRTPEETRAAGLAELAGDAARRGDYAGAMRTLDEAERIAPRFALVQQYRANVAYLMGDRKAASNALRKGLQLEPDNALFRENLKALEQPAKSPP